MRTLIEALTAPLLVAVSTVVARRWGARVGGLISAFPAVVGPVLLIIAQQSGDLAAARAANATLLGLVALSGFVVAYGAVSRTSAWPLSLAAGWACALALASVSGWYIGDAGFPTGLLAAVLSLVFAQRALARYAAGMTTFALPTEPRGDLVLRVVMTGFLILLLTALSRLFGPLVGGMLAALPVLASVLAVFTHRRHGAGAAITMLRGMLTGMAGFVGFCAVIALLVAPAGTGVAFTAATMYALAAQALVLAAGTMRVDGLPPPSRASSSELHRAATP